MPRRATLKDVAKAAGVHPGTVSRVLHPETRSLVNAETAARIEALIAELNYRPNVVARGLRMRHSKIVAVVIPDLTNPLFPPIVRGIEACLHQAGYVALVVNTDNDPERELESFTTMRERQVDGFIAATAATGDRALVELDADGVPVVLVNRSLARPRIPAIVPDDRDGMRQAVEHVIALGHRRIAHIAGPRELSSARARRASFEAAVRRAGVADAVSVVAVERLAIADGAEAAAMLLDADGRPTAILAANDLVAIGAYHAASSRGLVVPDDVSIVGFNDMPFAELFQPPLTTVHVPHHELGRRAAVMLLELLERRESVPRGRVTLPVELVVRGSTSAPARLEAGRQLAPA